MAHAAMGPGIGREFEPFLFALIGEGQHGHPLSMISALAQSDIDPWLEATGLAKMSRELAKARLSRLIRALPDPLQSSRPIETIVEELVALLPRPQSFSASPASTLSTATAPAKVRLGVGLAVIAIMMALTLMFSMRSPPTPAQGVSLPATVEKDLAKP